MNKLVDRLQSIASEADAIAQRLDQFKGQLDSIQSEISEVGKAWCGSWFGYHACIYYDGLQPPPPGARFDPTMGFMSRHSNRTAGDWAEYSFDEVTALLKSSGGKGVFAKLEKIAATARPQVSELRERLLSVLTAAGSESDAYLERLLKDAESAKALSASNFVAYYRPSGKFFSHDVAALAQGLQAPPHIAVLCELQAIDAPFTVAKRLAGIARRAADHLENRRSATSRRSFGGTTVFIGHGRSTAWKDLKDFIQDRLGLSWDEFNRVPVAGITNIARLSQMLDAAAIAFLVMTAEDEQRDGRLHARMNVIHEAGLFQGRLGFERAIVLLEEGCEEFSNIQGLGQIRFPAGNIAAVFEDIRQVLEREGLLEQ